MYRYFYTCNWHSAFILSSFHISINSLLLWSYLFGILCIFAKLIDNLFFNYKMTLLSADQRNYEVMGYYQIVISSKMCLQMIFAFYVKSFYLFLLLEIIFGVLYSVILNIRISKVYPWLDSDIKLGRKLFKNILK